MSCQSFLRACVFALGLASAFAANAAPSSAAFAYSSGSATKLRMVGTSSTVTVDALRRGWVQATGSGNSPTATANFLVGVCGTDSCNDNGIEHRNWFEFDVPGAVGTVVSAELLLDTIATSAQSIYTAAGPVTYTVRSVAPASYPPLTAGTATVAEFNALGTGTVYGSRVYTTADNNQALTSIPLSAAAVTYLNTRTNFTGFIGGALTPIAIPTPAVPTNTPVGLALLVGACLLIGVLATRARRAS